LSDIGKIAEIGFRVVACARPTLVLVLVTGLDTVIDVHPDLNRTPLRPWLPVGRR
jgi:hypothetical protein